MLALIKSVAGTITMDKRHDNHMLAVDTGTKETGSMSVFRSKCVSGRKGGLRWMTNLTHL